MGKAEDEIQKKLVELEISIKDEEAKTNALIAKSNKSTELTHTGTSVATTEQSDGDPGLYHLGGVVCVVTSVGLLLGHMRIGTAWMGFFGMGPMPTMGLMIVPLLIGIGMLCYDYKSRLAQGVTLASVALILSGMLSSMSIVFPMLSLLEFVMIALPLCLGGALLMKAHVKRRQIGQK